MSEKNEPQEAVALGDRSQPTSRRTRVVFWSLMLLLLVGAFVIDHVRMERKQYRGRHSKCMAMMRDDLRALHQYHETHGVWPTDPPTEGETRRVGSEERWGCQFNEAYMRKYLRPEDDINPADGRSVIVFFEKHDRDEGVYYVVGYSDGSSTCLNPVTFECVLERTGQTIPE